MANKIGRFEILSEIVHSDFSAVYKAADPESGQTIALKTIQLQMLGDQASVLVDQILQEAEGTKPLNSHNIALLYGLEEIEGQFCAAMEYVQGNSIGTMLARKEGFSIWDLQDIARQTCQGLDHAHSHHVVHYSLEPAKIMVTWDGTVKVLSFGASSMGAFTCQAAGKAPEVLHYVSPEQLRGDPVDGRSNIFSLGAILYEMVTENKAFSGDDADEVRHAIHEATPVAPDQINPKIHPALSELIMKALAKAPEDRYQSGQDLVNDLEQLQRECAEERCEEGSSAGPRIERAEAGEVCRRSRRTCSEPKKPAPAVPAHVAASENVASARSLASTPAPAKHGAQEVPVRAKAAAAAAGWESASRVAAESPTATEEFQSAPSATGQSSFQELASAVAEVDEAEAPAISVDPAMVEKEKGESGPSFSEISELPPLKEIYTPPPPPPPAETSEAEPSVAQWSTNAEPEKPKVQPREVARKAVTEIKKTPPKLFAYSIAAAMGVILLVVGMIWWRIHSENSADDGSTEQTADSRSRQLSFETSLE